MGSDDYVHGEVASPLLILLVDQTGRGYILDGESRGVEDSYRLGIPPPWFGAS